MSIVQVPYLANIGAYHWSHAHVRIGAAKLIGRYDGMRYLKPGNGVDWSLNMHADGWSCHEAAHHAPCSAAKKLETNHIPAFEMAQTASKMLIRFGPHIDQNSSSRIGSTTWANHTAFSVRPWQVGVPALYGAQSPKLHEVALAPLRKYSISLF